MRHFFFEKNHVHGVAVAQGVLLHESEAGDEEFQKGYMTTRLFQTTPSQNGDGIVGWNNPIQNAND